MILGPVNNQRIGYFEICTAFSYIVSVKALFLYIYYLQVTESVSLYLIV